MPWSRATLVHAVTATTGTNDYVLGNPSGASPYRTDAQANADGSLNDGAIVHYEVRDTEVTGDASFERGWGIYTLATRTIARTAANVLDSDAGPGVLKDWGLSGQRDVIILEALDGSEIPDAAAFAANLGLPLLSAQNNFTNQNQVFSNAASLFLALRRAANSGTLGDLVFQGNDSGGNLTSYARLRGEVADNTNGSEDGRVYVRVMVNGAETNIAWFDFGGIRDAVNNKHVAFPTGGTVEMQFGSAPPTGWTRINETTNRVPMLATVSDTPGATGGSWTVSGLDVAGSTDGTTLTEAQIPGHTHPPTGGSGSFYKVVGSGGSNAALGIGSAVVTATATGSTGGGGSHSHTLGVASVTSDGNWRPLHRIVVRATYD